MPPRPRPYIHPTLANVNAPIAIGPLTGDLPSQGRSVLEALSAGEITPSQAATIMQAPRFITSNSR
ncbi:MAG: hypothetical protein ABW205_12395 [Burkholderiales bacterium]